MITTFTITEIDRAIYNKIRLALVAAGYLPDITTFTGPTAEADYQAAKETITTGGGHVIEVLGVGYNMNRGERLASHITINRIANEVGSIGGGVKQHIPFTDGAGNKKFKKIQVAPNTRNLVYEIRLHTDKTGHSRVVTNLIWTEIGSKGYLPTYLDQSTESGKQFYIMSNGDTEDNSNEWIEWRFRFTALDMWLDAENVIATDIVPLTSVCFSLDFCPRDLEDPGELPPANTNYTSYELKDFNLECNPQTVHFALGAVWRMPYSTLFPDSCGDIAVLSVQNEEGTEFVGDVNTTIDNNITTKIVTITFQNAEQGFIILGVSTP